MCEPIKHITKIIFNYFSLFCLRYDVETDAMFCCPPVFQSVAYSGKWDFAHTNSTNLGKYPHAKLHSDDQFYVKFNLSFFFNQIFCLRCSSLLFMACLLLLITTFFGIFTITIFTFIYDISKLEFSINTHII